jgi:protein-disulfide isomerase/uncharacterized membrane protein
MKNSNNTHPVSEKKVINWFIISTVLAAITHLYLTSQHYSLKLGLSSGQSICNLNATFNCDAVAASKFAAIFGIPMAVLGLIAQIVLLIFIVTIRFQLSEKTESLKKVTFFFSAFVALVSLVMGIISTFQLQTFCLFCIAAYLLSFFSLFLSYLLQKGLSPSLSVFEPRWSLIMTAMIPALAWMINSMTLSNYGYDRLDTMIRDSIAEWKINPQYNFNLESGLVLGNPKTAKITIVEFADFLCPHCKTASATLDSFAHSYSKDVALIFKTFPLDGSCNDVIQNKGNGVRCKLAALPICAEEAGQKGWLAHQWIFDNQENLSRVGDVENDIIDFSGKNGLDFESIKTCLSADATIEKVKAMAAEGAQAKIQGTPTIFVNGRLLPRGQALPILQAIYKEN